MVYPHKQGRGLCVFDTTSEPSKPPVRSLGDHLGGQSEHNAPKTNLLKMFGIEYSYI